MNKSLMVVMCFHQPLPPPPPPQSPTVARCPNGFALTPSRSACNAVGQNAVPYNRTAGATQTLMYKIWRAVHVCISDMCQSMVPYNTTAGSSQRDLFAYSFNYWRIYWWRYSRHVAMCTPVLPLPVQFSYLINLFQLRVFLFATYFWLSSYFACRG